MPPKPRGPLSRTLSQATATPQTLLGREKARIYYCPTCATRRRSLSTRTTHHQQQQQPIRRQRHNAYSHAHTYAYEPPSTTLNRSIGATARGYHSTGHHRSSSSSNSSSSYGYSHAVPSRYRELYERLSEVRDAVPGALSLSRVQLALRGLESEEPVVRVAVLGLNDAAAARRLVRLLLADPLVPRGDWEDILDSYDADTSRGLLIRYGEVSKTIHNDLLPTISVPSSVLKNGNLEILVSSLGADAVPPGVQVTADTFLVPIVPIRTSHSGRHNFVRYPVHRTLVCGSGVDGLLAYSGLVSRSATREDGKLVYGAIELPVENKDAHSDDRIAFVDLEEAVTGLDRFRESVKNAPDYERGWNKSGVQRTLDWLSSLRSTGGKLLDPTLERLIGSLIDAAEEGVRVQEVERVAESEALSVSDEVRTGLDQAVSTWAERGHTELRHSLDEGFSSRTWRELRWWKLFWHVDDVTMLASDILERNYLRQAEKELIWTSGKLQQAGLLSEPQEFTNNNITDEPVTVVSENTEELAKVNNNKGDGEIVAMTVPPPQQQQQQQPWPSQISESRNRLLNTFGPSLQAVAQRLVLFSISTTTLTSALSALTYISVPTASIYESCTVAAVGIAYSLRRQQKRWDSARASWESDVREDGRMSLRETEGILKAVVREGGKVEAGESDGRVREAIDGARRALEAAK